jgi:hypothetical protein
LAFKSLVDRLRSKPEWQHSDPGIRAEAVLRLPAGESDLLAQIAREDVEPRVRRAAVKKLSDPALLGELSQADTEEGVRAEAVTRLAALVVHGHEEGPALVALALVTDARHLGEVARSSALESVRNAAIARLHDARTLAAVVRECTDPATRLVALARIDDAPTLLGIAQKTELRAVALAAVDRLTDPKALEAVAAKARLAPAARRARARLADLAVAGAPAPETPAEAPPPVSPDDDAEREAYERERLRLASETAALEHARAARAALCEKLETAEASAAVRVADEVRAAWADLPPFAGSDASALSSRFDAAVAQSAVRHAAYLAAEARRGELDALIVRAEAAVEVSDLDGARAAFDPLAATWAERATGESTPFDLRERWRAVVAKLQARRSEVRVAHQQQAQENLSRLVSLAASLESLAKSESLSLRDADHAIRDARAAIESPGPLPTKHDRESLAGRFEAVRKAIFPRLQELRDEAEWKRWANVDVQEELCRRAEALLEGSDLEKAAAQVRDLDARWKQAKEAPKDKAEAFWTRFKAARDEVRSRCDAFFAKKAAELAENLARKEALCARAEALSESTEWLKTTEALKALQAEWKEVGPTVNAPSKAVWERFRKACDRFFTRRDEDRVKRREDSKKNLEAKRALCEKAEALAESSDWDTAAAEIKKLQGEWKQTGPVRPSDSDAIWQRFRAAADRFFDRYKRRDEIADTSAVEAREAICAQLQALASDDASGLAEKVAAVQAAWRQAPGVSSAKSPELTARYVQALAAVIEAQPAAFAGTDLDPEASLTKLEKLCAKVEAARALAEPAQKPEADLATRLREALATNTMGGQAAAEAKWREATTEVEAARAAFSRLGPLPGARGSELRARFEGGVAGFFAARPALSEPKVPSPRESKPRRSPSRGPRPGSEARPRSG